MAVSKLQRVSFAFALTATLSFGVGGTEGSAAVAQGAGSVGASSGSASSGSASSGSASSGSASSGSASSGSASSGSASAAVNLTSQALNQKSLSYKMSPDDGTWREFLETLRIYLSDAKTLRAPSAAVIQQNKGLKDVQAKALDAGGARVWTFPGSPHNHSLIIQSGGATSAEGAGGARVSIVAVPETVNITAAKIVKSFTTKTTPVKVGRRKVVQKTVKVEGPSFLAVAGLDRVSGLVYLGAFKPVSGAWVATSEPYSQIPGHFMQTLSGQVSFSGNDLVLSVASQTPGSTQPSETGTTGTTATGSASAATGSAPAGTTLPKPKSSSYQIVLKFNNGHYVLGGSPSKDVPLSVVSYFVQCVRQNRMDLAKAWIADPALVSIPKYAKLLGRNQEPYKLVAMTQPPNSYARYRLVTGQKHDLIFDVGKVKKDILIKGIFIAPPDALARNLSGTTIGGQPTPPPTQSETPAATPASPAAPAKN